MIRIINHILTWLKQGWTTETIPVKITATYAPGDCRDITERMQGRVNSDVWFGYPEGTLLSGNVRYNLQFQRCTTVEINMLYRKDGWNNYAVKSLQSIYEVIDFDECLKEAVTIANHYVGYTRPGCEPPVKI